MNYTIRVAFRVGVAHQVSQPGHEPCRELNHGHLFRVSAAMQTRYDAKLGAAHEMATFSDSLVAICHEINGRDLNVMLPASHATIDGLATWFLDRLAVLWPRCFEVELYDEGSARSVTVSRELRGTTKL